MVTLEQLLRKLEMGKIIFKIPILLFCSLAWFILILNSGPKIKLTR